MRIILALIISITASVSTAQEYLNIPGTDYWGLNFVDAKPTGEVLYSTAGSYDGFERDISRFYTTDAPQVRLGGFVGVDGVDYSFFVDTGYNTAKLNVTPSISGSITKDIYTHQYGQDKTFSINASVAASVSAGVTHKPCLDIYDRQYYCATLTAWSDFDQKTSSPEFNIDSVDIKLNWNF